MNHEIYRSISYFAILSTLIPLVCLFIYRKEQPRQNLIIAVSLYISLAFDIIGFTMAKVYQNNMPANNLYCIVAFPAIMWFYHETLIKRSLKIVVRIFALGFLILATIFAYEQGVMVLNHNTHTLSSILITSASLFFVVDLSSMDHSNFAKNPYHETNILLNTSLALYYFVAIVAFTMSDSTLSSPEDYLLFWSFQNVAHVLKCIGIAVAFYLTAKRTRALGNLQNSHASEGVNN